jgi:hypothetical protein
MTFFEVVKDAQQYVPVMMGRIFLFVIGLVVSAGTIRWSWETLYLTWWKNRQQARHPKPELAEPPGGPIEWPRR